MKQILVALAVVFSSVGFSQTKIGHVNSQKLLDTLPSRKIALKKLEERQKEGMVELEEMQKSFEQAYRKHQETKKDKTPMLIEIDEANLMKKQQAIEMRQQSLEQEIQAYNEELNKPILERIQKAIEIIADRKKLNYIIDESVTLYFKGGIDCTQEVMVEMLRLDAESLKK
jgi:outer membrane protein